ncbi:MAG: hypothetical protein ACP5H3_01815 [Candidatus Aenigmatarchaeota archaeon]|jgi:hypothetical protein
MRNLLKYKKGQFFIISIVSLSIVLYAISKIIFPPVIIDTSSVALRDDFFVFNNIVEKSLQTINLSKSCDDLTYNLQELKEIIKKSYAPRFRVEYEYNIISCNDVSRTANIGFNISLYSPDSFIQTNFTKIVNW